jgi:hypothetical protein
MFFRFRLSFSRSSMNSPRARREIGSSKRATPDTLTMALTTGSTTSTNFKKLPPQTPLAPFQAVALLPVARS